MTAPAAGTTTYVDSHFHIWDLNQFTYQWPTAEVAPVYRNFSLSDYDKSREATPVKYGVFVQAVNNSPTEAEWVMQLAQSHPSVKGIVAGINLTDPQISEVLEDLCIKVPLLVGARHVVDFEDDEQRDQWLLRDDVQNGLEKLADRNLTFDLLAKPPQLKGVLSVISKHPRLHFVLDHLGKPDIKEGKMDEWSAAIAAIAEHPNVYCKISGLVTEADLEHWKADDLRPYLQHALDVFGVDRCMFGSDWPVCVLASATFSGVYQLFHELTAHLSRQDQSKLLGENCIRFYGLKF